MFFFKNADYSSSRKLSEIQLTPCSNFGFSDVFWLAGDVGFNLLEQLRIIAFRGVIKFIILRWEIALKHTEFKPWINVFQTI